MPRVQPPLQSFNAGETTPRLGSRTDFSKYAASMEIGENLIPLSEGPLMRRSGSRYAWELKSSTVMGRIKRFVFNAEQAYILEMGNSAMRFGRNQGQITVPNTDAAIINGTFDSNINSWTDVSTGAAAISHTVLDAFISGTFNKPNESTQTFGDGVANGKSLALKFAAPGTGSLKSVTISVNAVSTSFNAVAKLYSDNSGSPGSQVGSDSATVSLSSAGNKTFTFSTKPGVSASTDYWIVIDDTSAGAGNVSIDVCADQGENFASGKHDTITSIVDGSGSFNSNYDWRMKISIEVSGGSVTKATGVLSLDGNGTDIAWARQRIIHTSADVEHVLRFRVRGAPGDTIELRVGDENLGANLINDRECSVGYHIFAFTPTTNNFDVQFRNKKNKSIYIDDVEFLDNEPLEIVAPWATADLFEVEGPQSNDILYFFHKDYSTYRLERYGHTSWSLEEVAWQDGPWESQNSESTTLTFSAETGLGVTVTASSHVGINGNTGFQESDIGRLIRLTDNSTLNWGWAIITDWVSPYEVTVDVKRTVTVVTAETTWRLGSWSETTGYPSVGTFFEERLFAARTNTLVQTFWASQVNDFENQSPDSDPTAGTWDGTVQDDDALDYTISSDTAEDIRWLSAGQDTLVIGTMNGEWTPSATGAVLTPSDIVVRRQTANGSPQVQPVRIDDIVLHLQRAQRKIREFGYRFESDGYKGFDMTRLARHITFGGITEMDFAEEPNSILWATRDDGQLLGMTYRREENVVGWTRHLLGGTFYQSITQVWQVDVTGPSYVDETTDANDAGNADWTVFPASEAVGDYVALGYTKEFTKLVFDYANGTAGIGGAVTWEYWNGSSWAALSGVTDNTTGFTAAAANNLAVTWSLPADWAPQQLNSGRKLYYVRARVTTVYTTNPVLDQGYIGDHPVVESVAIIPGENGAGQTQDSTDRDEVWLIVKRTINGATKRYVEFLERDYEDGHTQEDTYYLDSLITYDGAATTSITELDHLEGETVGVLGDGLVQADKVVSSGAITIATAASVVQVGLRYKHRYKSWRLEGGNPQGTAQGRTSLISHITVDVQNSMTIDHGPDVGNLTPETLGDGTNFYSGLSDRFEFDQDWSQDPRIYIENDDPVPFMLRGIFPEWNVKSPP